MSNANPLELDKFKKLNDQWWNTQGDLRTLHDINPARLAFIEKHCQLQQQNVLDVGCGGGILSEAMAKCGAVVTGIDLEKSAIEAANHHAKDSQYNITYIHTSIEDYQADNIDIITCFELLEHVDDPQSLIVALSQKCKPGTKVFLSTLNRNLKAYGQAILGAEYLLGLLPKQTHEYAKFIKPAELAAMARQSHLDVKAIAGLSYNPLTYEAKLTDDVSVNYLMMCQKQG